jgi:hypothetical protein
LAERTLGEGFINSERTGFEPCSVDLEWQWSIRGVVKDQSGDLVPNNGNLSNRVKELRREIAEIAEHNRRYLEKNRHSPNEQAEHEARKERVREIRAELFGLLERTAA